MTTEEAALILAENHIPTENLSQDHILQIAEKLSSTSIPTHVIKNFIKASRMLYVRAETLHTYYIVNKDTKNATIISDQYLTPYKEALKALEEFL